MFSRGSRSVRFAALTANRKAWQSWRSLHSLLYSKAVTFTDPAIAIMQVAIPNEVIIAPIMSWEF
jgi:hypothetical protein